MSDDLSEKYQKWYAVGKSYVEYYLAECVRLKHYGIKGMKWGVRRSRNELQYNRNSVEASLKGKAGRIKTSKGVTFNGISEHALDRIEFYSDRKVTSSQIISALTKPIYISKIKLDKKGRKSQQYVGRKATVTINPETGIVPTVWITGKEKLKKYSKKGKML